MVSEKCLDAMLEEWVSVAKGPNGGETISFVTFLQCFIYSSGLKFFSRLKFSKFSPFSPHFFSTEPGVVIVHVEACTHLHRTLSRIRQLGGIPSVALNPHTPAEMIENVLDLVDHVLVMTVNPGFGGQAFIPTMVEKVKKIRGRIDDRGLEIDLEVDGGIKPTEETIGRCSAAGANCFIAGSGMFKYDDMKVGVKEYVAMAEKHPFKPE